MGITMKRYCKQFRVETNAGRIVGHADSIEHAEYLASRGRGRWIFRWFDGRYCCARKY